jgi:hypothetical protein
MNLLNISIEGAARQKSLDSLKDFCFTGTQNFLTYPNGVFVMLMRVAMICCQLCGNGETLEIEDV